MPNFSANFGSSPPSTPDGRQRASGSRFGRGLASNPSTTPAGPPGQGLLSFTPAGPPPSTAFGSSLIAPEHVASIPKPFFASSGLEVDVPAAGASQGGQPFFNDRAKNGALAKPLWPRSSRPAGSSQFESGSDGDDEDNYEDEDNLEIQAGLDGILPPDPMDDDDDSPVLDEPLPSLGERSLGQNTVGRPPLASPSRGVKRSHVDRMADQTSPRSTLVDQDGSSLSTIIRQEATRARSAPLTESDGLILATEALMGPLDRPKLNPQSPASSAATLNKVANGLLGLWKLSPEADSFSGGSGEEGAEDNREPPFSKALYLASFILPLHHPPSLKPSNVFSNSRSSRPQGFVRSFSAQTKGRSLPFPKILLNWLDEYHNPYPGALDDVRNYRPNPARHPYFWDVALSSILRGRLDDAIQLLKGADFRFVDELSDPQNTHSDFVERRLRSIREVISRVIQTLEQCPAVTSADWTLAGNNWAVFRLNASQASRDLTAFVEGAPNDDGRSTTASFSAEHFGIRTGKGQASSFLTASKAAACKIPWEIYEHLKAIYGILRGNSAGVMSLSQDWIEASIGLTVWWDGQMDTLDVGDALSKQPKTTVGGSPRQADLGFAPHYLERLAWSFQRATMKGVDDSFQLNTLDQAELSLAAAFSGDVEAVVGFLRSLSLPVAASVVQIGRRGGWLGSFDDDLIMDEFDQSDLMVLSYDRSQSKGWKDDVLAEYADGLVHRGHFDGTRISTDPGPKEFQDQDGWELAVQVLSRLSHPDVARKRIGELLDQLPLGSAAQVEKLLEICRAFGLTGQGERTAEKYADSLVEDSADYGQTLYYYARAHQRKKLKAVADLLVSYCLVRSTAYPPDSELDERLQALIHSPKETLSSISKDDREAAEMLRYQLSGYASVRAFYNVRDQQVNALAGQKPTNRESARKKSALDALLALIKSAADSIYGGLYDERRVSVISIDGLLVLLGETMVFVDQPKRFLSLRQIYDLLTAIEDLQTVTPRIYSYCEELLQKTLASAQGSQVSPPHETLKKSLSSLTASAAFSLVGSSMLEVQASGTAAAGRSASVSLPDPVKRAWDWRAGLLHSSHATGKDLLHILRLGLAKDLSRAWLDGGGGD